jgi:regulator of replication initiation timing
MYDPVVIQMLEKNVRDLQEQLRNSYVKIKQLNEENYKLRRALGIEKDNGKNIKNSSGGVWLGDAEMPDAEHLKDG